MGRRRAVSEEPLYRVVPAGDSGHAKETLLGRDELLLRAAIVVCGKRHCTVQQESCAVRQEPFASGSRTMLQRARAVASCDRSRCVGGNIVQGERTATAAGSTVVDGWTLRRGGWRCCCKLQERAAAAVRQIPLRQAARAAALGGGRRQYWAADVVASGGRS